MSNNKQSSVEWLYEAMFNHLVKKLRNEKTEQPIEKLLEQAKAKHQQEITTFTAHWSIQYKDDEGKCINDYYNEVFGSRNL